MAATNAPVQLTADDITLLRRAIRREEEATAAYQVIELRARADVLDAARTKTDVIHALSDKYAFDARETWAFDHATGIMKPQPKV